MTEVQILLDAAAIIEQTIKEEFIAQGHTLTEAWEQSIISQDDGEHGVGIYATGYGMIVDVGIIAARIPFGGVGTGSTEPNKYILGLQRFWKLRKPGISDKQALKLAFATADVHKEEGLSTEASKAYSSTGQRQHFMEAIEVLFKESLDLQIFNQLDELITEEADEPQIMYL